MNEECRLCRIGLSEKCFFCQLDHQPNCPIVTGECGHKFHKHCIQRWMEYNRKCPSCDKKFIAVDDQEILELSKTEPKPKPTNNHEPSLMDLERLKKDLDDFKEMQDVRLTVPNEEDLHHFLLAIKVNDGLYKNKWFRFNFSLPNDWPHSPPEITIIDNIWHPNINLLDKGGNICDFFKKDMYMPSVLLTSFATLIQCLLIDPDLKNAVNQEAAQEQLSNYPQFTKHVEEYLHKMPDE